MLLLSPTKNALHKHLPVRIKRYVYRYLEAIRCLGTSRALRAMNRKYSLQSTIVVSGCPRSGTTWVAEVLNTIPGSTMLYEPLYLRAHPILREIGFRWQTHLNPEDRAPEAKGYMKNVLEGKVLNPWTLSRANVDTILNTTTWIVKFVRANMLLGWLVRQFPIMPPLVIIRHPCAVIASQLRKGSWSHVTAPAECPEFFAMFPQFSHIRDRVRHLDEILAVQWCMEYFTILNKPAPHPWLLVSYENLVQDPEKGFSSIFSHFNQSLPSEGNRIIHKDSSTTVKNKNFDPGSRLSGWKNYLNKDQVARIFRVINEFGIDLYTDAIEPDYEKLGKYVDSLPEVQNI